MKAKGIKAGEAAAGKQQLNSSARQVRSPLAHESPLLKTTHLPFVFGEAISPVLQNLDHQIKRRGEVVLRRYWFADNQGLRGKKSRQGLT
jgi:hypothetical protein